MDDNGYNKWLMMIVFMNDGEKDTVTSSFLMMVNDGTKGKHSANIMVHNW